LEAKYLLKLMLGDMRIGVKQSLVEEAIATAANAPVDAVRRAVMLEADLSNAVKRAFAGTLNDARMRLFHPLGFMLASPVETPEEAVERFTEKPVKVAMVKAREGRKKKAEEGPEDLAPTVEDADVSTAPGVGVEAFLEDKYDGMRAQVHCGDAEQPGRVAIYSRNRDDVTESFPELEEAFARVLPERDGALIFDGEILGWDLEAGRALPFAVLGQRIGRKRVSNGWRQQVPVIFMAFDLMYAGGELLLELPLRERRNRLEAVVEKLVERVVSPVIVDERARDAQTVLFAGVESASVERLMISPSRLVESADDIERAYADARARANEGVMLKAAGSAYQPGRRGLAWVKLKRELATLDVVVTGAEFGHGKRAGILSDYTFAVRDANGELFNVGKAYSGLTDAEIAAMSAWMMEHTLEDKGFFRTVEPLMVLEVAFNNIMRSGRHSSGFALRFPRILRIRTDKPVSEIDTVERVEEIYQSQVDKPADV
jgi:DNA ligase-1